MSIASAHTRGAIDTYQASPASQATLCLACSTLYYWVNPDSACWAERYGGMVDDHEHVPCQAWLRFGMDPKTGFAIDSVLFDVVYKAFSHPEAPWIGFRISRCHATMPRINLLRTGTHPRASGQWQTTSCKRLDDPMV